MAGLALTLLALSGCAWLRRGPVSGEVLSCRQLTQRGISAIDRGDWPKAEALLAQAVKTCPVDCEARRLYAEALWQRGAGQQAIEQLEEAMRLSTDDPGLLVRSGEMRLAMGQLDPAFAAAAQAMDLDPALAAAWRLRARAMQQAGHPRQALSDYHRCLGHDPENREALLQVAELHRQLNQPQRALLALQVLLDSYPAGEEPRQALVLAALAYSALGRHQDAAYALRAAVDHGPPEPELLLQLAEAEWAAGRPMQARVAADRALSLAPGHSAILALMERLPAVR
jgi:tetratricopeptide (TPR) repeat protein